KFAVGLSPKSNSERRSSNTLLMLARPPMNATDKIVNVRIKDWCATILSLSFVRKFSKIIGHWTPVMATLLKTDFFHVPKWSARKHFTTTSTQDFCESKN